MRLPKLQQQMIDRMKQYGGKVSAADGNCPDHPATIRALLRKGLIEYKDDPVYLYHRYVLKAHGCEVGE